MKSNQLIYIGGLLGLVIFDSLQQKYYIDTFDLATREFGIFELFINHLIRWVCWLLIALPIGMFYWRRLPKTDNFSLRLQWLQIFVCLITAMVGIVAISVLSINQANLQMEWNSFSAYFSFYFFQKGLTFSVANIMVLLIIHNQFRRKLINEQIVQIHLFEQKLYEIQHSGNSIGQLQVKTGNRISNIPIDDIVWIQSDDYCAKIHVKDRTFTIRKSLKELENQLAPCGFLRIHRCALINLRHVELVNTSNQKVTLHDHPEIPASKSGLRALKSELKNQSFR